MWQDHNAHASAILVGSMTAVISMDVVELPTSQLMWERLYAHYKPTSDVMYLSVVHQEHSLQQLDATVDDF